MIGHRQKGKHLKRRKSWHRGRSEARRWAAACRRWPDLKIDLSTGLPKEPDERLPRG